MLVPGFGAGTMNAPGRFSHSRTESHGHGEPVPRSLFVQYEEPSPPETIGSSNYTTDHFDIPPAKRQRLSGPGVTGLDQGSRPRTTLVTSPDSAPKPGKGPSTGGPTTPATTGKSKRVRTGCLTCRDRHLKCDEGLPDCLNCRKSSRECSRGIRLNFIDVKVEEPPDIAPTSEWSSASPSLVFANSRVVPYPSS